MGGTEGGLRGGWVYARMTRRVSGRVKGWLSGCWGVLTSQGCTTRNRGRGGEERRGDGA